ncbi:MAG: thioesterase family protein [Gemmatimonadaceae bacterium]|nr:thioesterase family protein [Gemmatimonadaceae bacterium]
MPHIEETRLRVRYAETDQMGVVYHANYLIWCEVGRTDYIRRFGLTYAQMEARGLKLAVADAALRFLASARYDDEILVRTRLTGVRSRALHFGYEISNAATGVALVTASTQLVSLDANGRLTALWPELRERLAAEVLS